LNNKIILLLLIISLASCDKLTKKVENFDLFGLDQAGGAIDKNNEKIKAARDYQKEYSTSTDNSPVETSILGNH